MRHFVIASHGKLAEGMMDAVQIILGCVDCVQCFCAYVDLEEDVEQKVDQIIHQFPEEDELIVITDILGGSVCNAFSRHLHLPNLHIIAGMNLGMLLELLINKEKPLQELLQIALDSGKESVCYCNGFKGEEDCEDF